MAAPKGKQKAGTRLEDLQFYFDSVERERLDAAGWSRRSSELLVIRDRLLKLPAPAYEAAISTMKTVVADKPTSDEVGDRAKVKRDAAATLFANVQNGRT